jgi:hypothetical protein
MFASTMAHPLRRSNQERSLHLVASESEKCSEEHIANMLRKIGIVAACIDLYHWRQVIDQVLRETEAERRLQIRHQPMPGERTAISA